MITIYHNPRCGKSIEALAFLQNNNLDFKIIKYLDQPLSYEKLTSIVKKLNFDAIQLVRTKEKVWIENFKGKQLTNEEILVALVAHPILIERPIVIKNNSAIIARSL